MTSLNFTLSRTLGRAAQAPATRSWSPGSTMTPTSRRGWTWPVTSGWRSGTRTCTLIPRLDLADLERQLGPRTQGRGLPVVRELDRDHRRRPRGLRPGAPGRRAGVGGRRPVRGARADGRAGDRRRRGGVLGLQVLRPASRHRLRPPGAARVLAALQGQAGARSSRSVTGSRPAPCPTSCSAACSRPTPTWTASAAWRSSRPGNASSASGCWPGFRRVPGSTACPTMAGRVPTFLINFPGVPSAMSERGTGRTWLRRVEPWQLLRARPARSDRLGRGAAGRARALQHPRRDGPVQRGAGRPGGCARRRSRGG